jgi:N-acetylglucosamine kinase-like BadF-type ATPase
VAQEPFVIHDSVAALYAATKGRPGIIVNSGTGSFAAGINGAGEYVRVGGWGYLIDDKGSAFDIGMKAITMGYRMMDGRTPATDLIPLLKRRFRVTRFDQILDNIYSNRISVEEIARLAPYVSKEASHDNIWTDNRQNGRGNITCRAALHRSETIEDDEESVSLSDGWRRLQIGTPFCGTIRVESQG